MKRALLALLLTGVAMLGLATPALAHNVLISSDPAKGASLQAGPAQVRLTFDQYVQAGDVNQVAVTGPDGSRWTEGQVRVEGNVVTAPLRPLGPAGSYTIGYHILSADGHPVTGEIGFALTTPGTGTPASATAPGSPATTADGPGSSGVPIWVWIAGAVVLLGVGLTVALRAGGAPGEKDRR
jgi:methionine-rich copper-binding protein CopC